MDNDFDSVSWHNDEIAGKGQPSNTAKPRPHEDEHHSSNTGSRRTNAISVQAGQTADDVDLAGVGSTRLDCTVNTPLKESDGTKDAYVSYLCTTTVSL